MSKIVSVIRNILLMLSLTITVLFINTMSVEAGTMVQDTTGQWRYSDNGRIDYSYTGMACNEYGWWYYQDGQLDWNYTGMACNEYGWWYYRDGRLDWNYTGMACNEYGWWYYQDGRLDWNYTGMALNEYGWWYYQNGNLDWGYTGMALNEYGWWYYQDGRLDWGYTGMACNENGWWYYQDGRLDWNYTGMGLNEYGWWLYQNGNIAWDYTGDVYADNAIYKIVNGHAVDVVDVSQNTSDSNPTVSITEEQAYAAIIAMKEEYPEGMPWGNDKTYISKAKGTEHKGTACHAFALILSDAAFDDLPFEKHTDLTKIRVGDILRINNDTHSVVVLEVKSDSVIVAEGNYNSSVHWGREISMSKIYETNTVVWTRYPD